jgi:dTDP-4-dehydrorhamnose reductase
VRLLVSGGAGYLGSELCAQAVARGFDVLATEFHAPVPHGRAVRLDIRDADAAQRVFLRHGPAVVVHTAYVQGDAPTIVQGSATVAAAAHRSGARLVHLSTDLVFDGEQGAPYDEAADPRPLSAYGAAKLEAERVVARVHPDALLVRTSLLYGKPGRQEALALADGVELFTDEIRCPTLVSELAAALLELAELDVSGLLHVAASEAVSRYDFGRLLRARHGGDPDEIRGAPTPKGRARNVALDSSRAAGLLETRLRGVTEALGP